MTTSISLFSASSSSCSIRLSTLIKKINLVITNNDAQADQEHIPPFLFEFAQMGLPLNVMTRTH
jgi:hypothetical protein